MKTNKDYKNEALAALKGNWPQAVLCAVTVMFLMFLIASPAGYSTISQSTSMTLTYLGFLLNIFLLYPLMLGYSVAHNRLLTDGDTALTANMIKDSYCKGYLRNVVAMLLVYLYTFLWSLLLIIPGIIKGFSYSMTPFIVKDYPELSVNQAINLSMKMMKGRKFDLFWLYLSFFGWIFLSVFTLGIGMFWLMPYMQTAMASFYQDVKNDYVKSNI